MSPAAAYLRAPALRETDRGLEARGAVEDFERRPPAHGSRRSRPGEQWLLSGVEKRPGSARGR
jgi:hypothetical protein